MTKIYAQGNYIVIEANNERKTFQKKGVGFEIVNYDGLYSLNDKGLPMGDFNYSEVKKEDGSDYATPLEFETFLFENTGNFNSGADVSPNVIESLKIAYDHSQVTHDKNLVGLWNVDNTSDLNKPISTATQTALNLKLSTEAPSTTGTVISFSTDKVYGTLTTHETGNITADVTNAKLGVTNIVIHNSGTAPTFGSGFKKLSGSGNYVTGVVNYIYCTFISNTEIIYSINQRS